MFKKRFVKLNTKVKNESCEQSNCNGEINQTDSTCTMCGCKYDYVNIFYED